MSGIEIISGNPGPEEVAALVVVLAALENRRHAAKPAPVPAAGSAWRAAPGPTWVEHPGTRRTPDAWTWQDVTPWNSPPHPRHLLPFLSARTP